MKKKLFPFSYLSESLISSKSKINFGSYKMKVLTAIISVKMENIRLFDRSNLD